jgi:formylglycine-generating enzyme required for sulfatase activity
MPLAPSFNSNWKHEDHPIVNVAWLHASSYALWADGTLPTEAQWEKAARGIDGLKYPWGNDFDREKIRCSKSWWDNFWSPIPIVGTTAVGNYGISPYGCTDMAGNTWEWCRDLHHPNFWKERRANSLDPENQSISPSGCRVIRGGSWAEYQPSAFCTAYRRGEWPSVVKHTLGFRCVVYPDVL